MKKSLLLALSSGILLLGMTGNAMAYAISYNEPYNPGTNYSLSSELTGEHLSHSWIFNITDNPSWDTPGQVFNNGTITIVVEDDGGPTDGNEKATFTFDTGTGLTNANINSDVWDAAFTVDASAFSNGLIMATLTATAGDFYFRSAELNVISNVNGSVVPEPSTVVLLGSGLLGLIYVGRNRRRK